MRSTDFGARLDDWSVEIAELTGKVYGRLELLHKNGPERVPFSVPVGLVCGHNLSGILSVNLRFHFVYFRIHHIFMHMIGSNDPIESAFRSVHHHTC